MAGAMREDPDYYKNSLGQIVKFAQVAPGTEPTIYAMYARMSTTFRFCVQRHGGYPLTHAQFTEDMICDGYGTIQVTRESWSFCAPTYGDDEDKELLTAMFAKHGIEFGG